MKWREKKEEEKSRRSNTLIHPDIFLAEAFAFHINHFPSWQRSLAERERERERESLLLTICPQSSHLVPVSSLLLTPLEKSDIAPLANKSPHHKQAASNGKRERIGIGTAVSVLANKTLLSFSFPSLKAVMHTTF